MLCYDPKLFKPCGVKVNQNRKMEKYTINNGNFTEKGFSGYTAKGERIHLFDRQLEAIGIKKGDNLEGKFPFYVLAEAKSYPPRMDSAGQPIPNADGTFGIKNRLTATSVFKSVEALGQVFIDEKTLDARINRMVNDAVKSFKLDDASINAMANTPF
jgi:hypothetical protein